MKWLFIVLLFLSGVNLFAQTATPRLYDPAANATRELSEVVKKARAANKHVLIMAGGNWCSWCLEFNRFTTSDTAIDSVINNNYIVYHLNYSPENKNSTLFAKLGYPQRFGFPVFIVLDGNGNRLHIQNSSYLEQGRSYNKKKVIEFLDQWNKNAVDPKAYKNF